MALHTLRPAPMPTPKGDSLLTLEEAGAYLHVSPETLRRWTAQRRIDFVRVGQRLIRFRRSALDAWIEAHTAKAVPR